MTLHIGPSELIKSIVLICLTLIGRESISWQQTGNPLGTRTPSKNATTYNHHEPMFCTCSTIRRSKLRPGELLYSDDGGHFICSPNGKTWFGYDVKGDLSLWRDRKKVWSAKTAGMDTITTMQHDGNLVVYRSDFRGGFPPRADMALWSSNTAERRGSYLSIEDDGHARIWFGQSVVWSEWQSMTGLQYPSTTNNVPNSSLPTPHIVWLMSFPNSGTSYTLDLVDRGCQIRPLQQTMPRNALLEMEKRFLCFRNLHLVLSCTDLIL